MQSASTSSHYPAHKSPNKKERRPSTLLEPLPRGTIERCLSDAPLRERGPSTASIVQEPRGSGWQISRKQYERLRVVQIVFMAVVAAAVFSRRNCKREPGIGSRNEPSSYRGDSAPARNRRRKSRVTDLRQMIVGFCVPSDSIASATAQRSALDAIQRQGVPAEGPTEARIVTGQRQQLVTTERRHAIMCSRVSRISCASHCM